MQYIFFLSPAFGLIFFKTVYSKILSNEKPVSLNFIKKNKINKKENVENICSAFFSVLK